MTTKTLGIEIQCRFTGLAISERLAIAVLYGDLDIRAEKSPLYLLVFESSPAPILCSFDTAGKFLSSIPVGQPVEKGQAVRLDNLYWSVALTGFPGESA